MMANEPLEMRLMTTDAQTQKTLDLLAWFDELRAKMLFTPLISAEEMRRMQSNATGNVQRKLRVTMADDEEEEFDAYTVLERAVRACDAEGIGPSLREGQRALAEVRRLRLAAQYAINVYDRYHFAASVEDFEKAANALRAELGQKAVHYTPVDNETEFERLRTENAAMFEKVMSRLDELEEKITNIRENMPGYDTDGGGYS